MDCRSVPPVSSSLEGEVSGSMPYGKEFEDFVFRGIVKVVSEATDGNIVALLRDTGSCQSCILETSLPKDFSRKGQDFVLLGGFPDTVTSWPVEEVYLESPLVTGRLKLAVVSALPVSGCGLLIGNDVMQGSGTACASEGRKGASVVNERVMVNVKPVVPVTRAQSREEVKGGEADINLEKCFQTKTQPKTTKDRQTLISAQKEDRELKSIYEEAEQLKEQDDLSEASYVLKNDVLYRLIRPVTASTDEEWKKDVVRHCKSCHQCQMVGKPNQKITKAPLIPIPVVEEPFTQIVIDIVGPLPKTKTGFQYMLTIMDRTTRFPEVIPVRGIRSGIVIKHLMDFFSRYGLPREIQSDQGSNFTSREFQAKMNELGIKNNLASSYHPEKKLRSIWQWAQNNLSTSQAEMKTHYDRKSQVRNFEAGEQVLVLLPMPDSLFKHLNAQEATDIKDLFKEHPSIFKDTPGLVRSLQHDVVLKPNAQPIRQAPYRLSPQKAEAVRKEVCYMLENDLITPSSSPWSSPVVLVKKENGQDSQYLPENDVDDHEWIEGLCSLSGRYNYFSDNWKDHVDRIRALFRAIADTGLVVKLSKCEFGKAEVIYLGHHVGQGGSRDERSLAAFCAWQAPGEAQSQGSVDRANSKIKHTLAAWLSDNNTRDWSQGHRFVQNQKNSSYHSGIMSTPYATLLGENPKDGLSSTSLLQEVIDRLETEANLAALGAQPPTDPIDEPLEASEPVIITTQPT
ncbi:uncharacterized protein [Palaemon carinicauda]|uniref:uncharacterized protein n=1 Tax=Palaemon carinicauda TaxID=392227 RepID=UPI0035B6427C